MSTTIWSGTLKSKKKNELQQICRELDVDFKSDHIKADLEQLIRNRFKEKPVLQEDNRFAKLEYGSSPSTSSNTSVPPASRRPNRARSVSRPPRGTDDDPPSSVDDNHSSRPTRSPSRTNKSSSLVNRNSGDSEPTLPQPPKLLVAVVNTEKGLERRPTSQSKTNPPSQATQLAKQTNQQALDAFNAFARGTARFSIDVIQTIQETFSCPWKLCFIAILAELTFVVYSTLPIRSGLYTEPKLAEGLIQVPEPMMRLLNRILTKTFMGSLAEYLSVSVMGPFVIAGLMNVPSSRRGSEPQGANKKQPRFQASRDLKPSVFVYCVTRLAVLGLVHWVFLPNHHFGWANQSPFSPLLLRHPSVPLNPENHPTQLVRNLQLSGFDSLQFVTTSFALLIALHRLIRPTSSAA